MAETVSNMMPIGTQAPDFVLTDVISGEKKSLVDIRGEQGLVVMFICAHCPFVKNLEEELGLIARQYMEEDVGFVGIMPNDIETYPDDAPDKLREQADEANFNFPYLFDETQEVAKAYDAACTPDFFLFDADLKCVYRGRFDSSTPGNDEPVTGHDLTMAINNMLEENEPIADQKPGLGCGIKWK